MNRIVIEVIYPEMNHLYGDNGNISYLKAKLDAMNVPYEVFETHLGDEPKFVSENVDFLYVGPTTEEYQRIQAKELSEYREAILSRIDSEKVTLMTGNAFELLGEYIEEESGERFDCLGIIHTYAKRFTRLRYNDISLGEWNGIEVVGFKNQLSHSYVSEGKSSPEPFLEMKKGSGWNESVTSEGFNKNWFFATYLIGPLLPLNPKFSEALLQHLCPDVKEIATLPYEMEAYERRLKEYKL